MTRYKLILTNDDGEVLQSWTLSPDPDNFEVYTLPLTSIARADILDDIARFTHTYPYKAS